MEIRYPFQQSPQSEQHKDKAVRKSCKRDPSSDSIKTLDDSSSDHRKG
ncbi:hypothetical protein CCACVL1_06458 [Corchorus capsularis]|uniref:Uncharacterized protein n=1 Tax=Corchorus capsularis TaxID=210143 RepID=A0A1R3JFC5_COCAP|nr:hypothetical protein CCACVL1_06458 [Corchorus capsularis]